MKKTFFLSFFVIGFIFSGIPAYAQSVGSVVDDAVNNFQKTFNDAKDSLPAEVQNLPVVSDASGIQSGILAGGLGESFSGIWNSFDSWTSEKLGISLGEIVTTISNFILWILDLFMRIIKGVTGMIPQ